MSRKRSAAEVEEVEEQHTPVRRKIFENLADFGEDSTKREDSTKPKCDDRAVPVTERIFHSQDDHEGSDSESGDDWDDNNLERYGEDYDDGIGGEDGEYDYEPTEEQENALLKEYAWERLMKRRKEELGHSDYEYSPTPSEIEDELEDAVNEEDGTGHDYGDEYDEYY